MLTVVPPDCANSDFTIVRAIVYRFNGGSSEDLRGIDKVDTVLIEMDAAFVSSHSNSMDGPSAEV